MRSSTLSTWPNIIVALEFSPSSWAMAMASSQRSLLHLSGAMRLRTRSTRISPPPPGIGAEARFLELGDDLAHRHLKHLREVVELRRAERVDVDVRVFLADVVEQVEIPVDRQLRVMPALHEDLDAADGGEFVEFLVDLLVGEDVMVGVLLGAVERAELAVHVADVRVIDVAVDDVGDDLVAVAVVGSGLGLVAAGVGERGEVGGRGVTIDFERLGLGNAFAGEDFGDDGIFERGAHRMAMKGCRTLPRKDLGGNSRLRFRAGGGTMESRLPGRADLGWWS